MNAKVANIVYKTVGVAGMSAVLYDAAAKAKRQSTVGAEELSADVFESSYAAKRSSSKESHLTSAVQRKISDLRMKNPLIPLIGKTKGFIGGFFDSLGDNIIPIIFSSMAMAAKGTFQKAGAWGLGIYAIYQVAKEGFGLGKSSIVDK